MPLVAVACCRLSGQPSASALYPDTDRELLAEALGDVCVDAIPVSWDDPDFDWGSAAAVLVRSTWDSVDRPEEYLRWARAVGETTTLLNPSDVLEWNLDKAYLQDLAAAGVQVLPTEWVRPGGSWRARLDHDVVVKPSISAGGRDTAWYSRDEEAHARAHVARLVERGHTVLVQPHVASVQDPGEIDLIYIGGGYSHAVRKTSFLERDVGVQLRPWERMS